MSSDHEKPQRAHVLELRVEGDTREALVSLLVEQAKAIRDLGSSHSVTGGYDCGGYFTITRDLEQTHDKYVTQLEAYLAAGGK